MLRRAVQKRPYDWEPLPWQVLQPYRSTISEATGLTPYRLTFSREMRLLIDLEKLLPEPPRDIRTITADVAKNLEWSYQIAREIINFGHRRAESRYIEKLVEQKYKPENLVLEVQHTQVYGVPSSSTRSSLDSAKFSKYATRLLLWENSTRLRYLQRATMQCAHRLCHVPTFYCKPNRLLSCRTHWMPSRVTRISRLAASKICVCLQMTSGCFPQHRNFCPLLTSILPRRQLSVLHCRRRNLLLVCSVMSVPLQVSHLSSRVPSSWCHSRSHPLLTLPSLVILEPIYPRILR